MGDRIVGSSQFSLFWTFLFSYSPGSWRIRRGSDRGVPQWAFRFTYSASILDLLALVFPLSCSVCGGGGGSDAVTGLCLLEGPGMVAKMVGRLTLRLASWSDHWSMSVGLTADSSWRILACVACSFERWKVMIPTILLSARAKLGSFSD